jgi:mono/diheme cytochrome c family protein
VVNWRRPLIALCLLAVVGIGAGGYAFIEARSKAVLDARTPLPPSTVRAAVAPQAIAQGGELTVFTACILCHGASLTGRQLSVSGSPIYAPNLTITAGRMSDADLDRAIRRGLRPNGAPELAMPSHVYAAFTDDEAAAIIGYLRSLAPRGVELARPRPGFLLRANLAAGVVKTEPERIAEARPPLDAGPAFEPGRHLAAVACGQCHGSDLGGGRGDPGPDLTVHGYYDRSQFHTLMRTGVGVDDADMELMSQVARLSFSRFSAGQIDAIYDYLDDRDRILGAEDSGRATH